MVKVVEVKENNIDEPKRLLPEVSSAVVDSPGVVERIAAHLS
jgi:hypothetical protein